MRTLRNVVSLLCALVLLLSVAPCALADTVVDEADKSNANDTFEGDVIVTTDGTITAIRDAKNDASVVVNGSLDNSGSVTSSTTRGNATLDVEEKLTNDGDILVKTAKDKLLESDSLENSGSIKLLGSGEGKIDVEKDIVNKTGEDSIIYIQGSKCNIEGATLENDGKIELDGYNNGSVIIEGEVENQENGTIDLSGMVADLEGKSLKNEGTIILDGIKKPTPAGDGGESILKTTDGGLVNSGSILVGRDRTNSEDSKIDIAGTLVNTEDGKIKVVGANAFVKADVIENYGTVLLEYRKDYEGRIDCEDVRNFGTITEQIDLNATNYYGISTIDEDGNRVSLLQNWRDGQENTIWALPTKDGYVLTGLTVNGNDYDLSKGGIPISGAMTIETFWKLFTKPIVSPDYNGSEQTEKSGEKIVKYMDGYKVLDADRKELKLEDEYFNVAKTSYNRLIVVFTWQQMAQMAEGEHLFYIVSPDNVETEYTLTIW